MQAYKRSAFTMLEVIFVIMILGIVTSIGSQIIVKVYENYIIQRAMHRTSIKTETTATQLANRLSFSIPGTIIGRIDDANFDDLESIPAGTTDRNILEWIGYDSDGFNASFSDDPRNPAWSGYADVTASSIDSLSTPGSKLGNEDTLIKNLSDSQLSDSAILFPDTYTAHHVGYSETNRSDAGIHPVSGSSSDTALTLDSSTTAPHRTIKEHYKLTWTAYAVVPTILSKDERIARGFKSDDDLWDLTLYYDYQPWEGETYSDGKHQPLIRNISAFNFMGTGNTVRFKLCQKESIGGEFSVNTCKEKAVIR